jgi:NAD+ synthase
MKPLEKAQFISNWIKDYVEKMPSKAQSLVIGISGGIDSSVSSTLSAMTGIKTIVLSMPIKQKLSQHDLSLKHQEWLVKNFSNVEAHTLNLDKLFETFEGTLSNFDNELGMANSRARIRMTTLYQVASANKGIVVGTGNKVEDFGVGFYTKYGDGGVDISPIADCNKSEVWEMGKSINILQEIIEAAPTDGLWDDGRTDEGQLGLKYSELEEAMNNVNSINREKYEKIRKINLHKMEPIPVCKIPN